MAHVGPFGSFTGARTLSGDLLAAYPRGRVHCAGRAQAGKYLAPGVDLSRGHPMSPCTALQQAARLVSRRVVRRQKDELDPARGLFPAVEFRAGGAFIPDRSRLQFVRG